MAARSAGAARWGALSRLVLAVRTSARPGSPGLAQRAAAVPRMIRATVRGEYAGMTRTHLVGLLGALLYVVSPIDVMPEGLLAVFGLADDAVLLAWMAAALVTDTEDYLAWERRPQDAPAWAQDAVRSHVVT